MISADQKRVQIKDIVENQLPSFVREDFPLISEFLGQYYLSQAVPNASADLIQNIDRYLKLFSLTNNTEETELSSSVSFSDTTINIKFDLNNNILGTKGFPERYGLLQIDDEIILYTSKTDNSFDGCIRGFSGITSYDAPNLVFSSSEISEHSENSKVVNLSALLLKQFLNKVKKQFVPGFENRKFDDKINERLFITRAKDFYQSKGTDESFKILFGLLYGEKVEVLKPKDHLFRPSDAQYRVTKDIVVESISGNPLNLLNNTLFQDEYTEYGIQKAYASITNVEKLQYGDTTYYKLSVDFDYSKDITFDGSIYGEFSPHPKTKTINDTLTTSSTIDVDSTIGFPNSGELVATYKNGNTGIIKYTSKSVNQFFGITGTEFDIKAGENIRLNVQAYGYIGLGTENRVDVRISSVLSDLSIKDDTYYFSKNDTAKIKSLGIDGSGVKLDDWIYNISVKYDVRVIELVDTSNYSYRVSTYSKNNFRLGDKLVITDSTLESKDCFISDINDEFSFSIKSQGYLDVNDNKFTIQRKILKPELSSSIEYPYLTEYTSNIQNVYTNFDKEVLVASASIPNYYNQPLDFYEKKIVLNGNYEGDIFTVTDVADHGYYTGDAVYYRPYVFSSNDDNFEISYTSKFDSMSEGIYYVKRLDNSNQFKLASSRVNLYNNNFISVSGIVTSNTLEYYDFYNKNLEHQKILREIKSPVNDGDIHVTNPGKTGILINGVEILNYKSEDVVYYGAIESISVTAKGNNYDIINPPVLTIEDALGIGASAICSVKGSLERIDLINPGFDYMEEPVITITGGNGYDATAEINTRLIDHSVFFNTSPETTFVDLSNNTIGFSSYHKFRDIEKVIYKTDGQQALSGIVTDAIYFARPVDAKSVKLYSSEKDAASGINTIQLGSYGSGIHRLYCTNKKRVISNVVVKNSGFNYENKKRIAASSGINTAANTINIKDHQYNSGDVICYSYDSNPISGLSSSTSYIVTKIDDDSFKLSNVGLGSISKLFYFTNSQYVNLSSVGSGNHQFNYEPIEVSIIGAIGVSTFANEDFSAKIQPIFRGSIESVQVTSSGNKYGVPDILNYHRQPSFSFSSGSSAQLLPIVNNGKIVEVLITNSGSNYNSPPNLVVYGKGKYAKLIPIVNEGKIVSVIIDSQGVGYEDKPKVEVIPSGSGCSLSANIQKWTVNLFEKYLNIISDDDGIITKSANEDYGLEYCHLYAPRKLRESIYPKDQDNKVKYGVFDLQKVNGKEVESQYHSPIIGWAYDGNPIYGPYGYKTRTGGNVRIMKSGYKKVSKSNRPSFPEGFFVEDYEFRNEGDLDEHNGRFCITPDFPNGVYAYFASINPDSIENSISSKFNKYRVPVFPYLIGNTFKSKPNSFNFDPNSNQSSYNLNESSWFRNTGPYALSDKNASYEFLIQPNKIKPQTINISDVSKGKIDSIGIVTGGFNYRVNEEIIFNEVGGNNKTKAKITKISGKNVDNISVASTTISRLEIYPFKSDGTYIAFSNSPHGLQNNDLISLSGFSTSVKSIRGVFNIGVNTERFILNTGIGTDGVTGIVTYLNVSGNLDVENYKIVENDILTLDNEKVKVIQIDPQNSRIKIIRAQESTVASAHTASTILYENPRKFTFKASIENEVKFELNKEIYFDPKESLGIGSISGVSIGTTIFFSNPGAGITQIFIPRQSIYLPNHGLLTGDVIKYNSNGGSSIGISTVSGGSTISLVDNSALFVAKLNKDLIGISTIKVGLGSTGTFVGIATTTSNQGLLYFVGIGSGTNHSFKTVKENSVNAEVTKNIVTVLTTSTHGLNLNDDIEVSVKSGITTTIVVKYNDHNRRIVFNPREFNSIDVNVDKNTITIKDHGFVTGDKVIYTSPSPSTGLIDQKIYYIFRYTKDEVKLCADKYQSLSFSPNFVSISSASQGTLSPINPRVNAYKNNTIKFDLSDSSLATQNGPNKYSSFDLNLYTDSNYTSDFYSSGKNNYFEISKVGSVGITSDASLLLRITNSVPQKLYYKFLPINKEFSSLFKTEIYIDDEVHGFNQIELLDSLYSGKFKVSGITSNTFNYNLPQIPEKSFYSLEESNVSYTTNSQTTTGGISSISILYSGNQYLNVVGVSTIKTADGFGCILDSQSKSIGKIRSNVIEDIGFDFPTDKTLRPVCNLPEILLIEALSSFEEIGITSFGKNYSIAPKLVVIDGYTGKVVEDVDLKYEIGDTKVRILKNTSGMYNVTPKIIPTSNQNGVKIKNISYNEVTKEVSVGLNTGFSDTFPFSVGDRVLVENISVGVGSTGLGYNSSNYNYSLFTLTKVPANNSALGGSVGVVTYSLNGFVKDGQTPGNYDSINSSGRIIAEKDFPIFDIKLKKNNFILGETISLKNDIKNSIGIVESWNNEINLLKVSSERDFSVGDIIIGKTSNTRGVVNSKIDFDAEINTDSSSIVKNGWRRETGFLNYNTERIPDNNYYQNFSYSLKSKVSLETWQDPVSSLNHTAGFLKFSDLVIESNDENFKGVFASYKGGDVDVTIDLYSEMDINCYKDFDLASENSLNINSNIISNEIYLNNKILTDYYESFGNRVLLIDDISTQFNDTPRPTKFSVVDLFDVNQRSKKYFAYIKDRRYIDERQFLVVSLLQNKSNGYLNQYGRLESQSDLGSFDFSISGSEGQLLFYPNKYSVNDYTVSLVSFDINSSITSIGSTNLGDIVDISSSRSIVPVGITTTVVSFASTYRSSKVILEVESDSGAIELDELNIIHDGTNVELLEYGQLTDHSFDPFSNSGLGTYKAYISGSYVNIDFVPNPGIACTVNSVRVSVSSTQSTGIGTFYLGFQSQNISALNSYYTSIASSPTPTTTSIASYKYNEIRNDYNAAYCVVSVEDLTNNEYEMFEVILLNDSSEVYITEYGNVSTTTSGLGTVGATINANQVSLVYKPIPNINAQVRVFQSSLRIIDEGNFESSRIDLNNALINSSYGFYQGSETDVRRSFELTHNQTPIFLRYFDGGNSSVVSVANNSIILPDHFFVSGEEVTYSYRAVDCQPIGIGSTTFAGIGLTNYVPSTVYIIKVSDTEIKLARSAEDALKTKPIELNITSVGVGTNHKFTSKNQNSKCIIAIDNQIQSPIVSTSVTTGLTTSINLADNIIKFTGITSFSGGDLIKINDEIMKINTVGFGSTNSILVDRPWMGTGISTHSINSVVTKIQGNYNIVDNTINFVTSPKGPIPIASSLNPPDERDWSGITTFSKFQGRTFLRNAQENGSEKAYNTNYIFDDISQNFNAISKVFTLKSSGQNVAGFSTNNAVILINGIFQGPTGQLVSPQDYSLSENSGITSITFTGTATSVAYDPNNANIPIGGVIVSVGSFEGFGYQPLVSAGGTSIVSAAGTISSISIGNSGSGYRPGLQTVKVGVTTSSIGTPSIQFIGTATVSNGRVVGVSITNPGIGYTRSNPPLVIFDSPLSYSDIPLIYSTTSPTGFGTQATIDIVVGQGSSVIDFEIKNLGYNYGQQQILTVPTSGNIGIPTDSTKPFNEFQIIIDKVDYDSFLGWHFGEIEVLDNIENKFNGIRKSFTLTKNSSPITIRSAKGSNIDVQSTLLVFLNDVLQVPGEGYTFKGGSVLTFAEAPRGISSDGSVSGDKCKILFYKGSGDVDVIFRDVLETVKAGDFLKLENEEKRLVTNVVSSDTVETNPYGEFGINSDTLRPVEWCKQTTDKIIDGNIVSKSRILNECLINPATYIIQPVGVGSTTISVESVKSFFDPLNENQTVTNKQTILIVSQNQNIAAEATAIVSATGTISSIRITNGGVGYSTNPLVSISDPTGFNISTPQTTYSLNDNIPVGLGTTAVINSVISIAGTVSYVTINNPGSGYTSSNPPQVLIESPSIVYEINRSASYIGDFGIIVGVSTTSVGYASTALVFDFYIPKDSVLRNTSIVSTATTISGIQTGYYFVVKNSNIGNGVTSLYQNNTVLGIGTQFLDNVYEVASVSIAQTSAPGIGVTYVSRVVAKISNYNSLTGVGGSSFFGEFSWGRILLGERANPSSFSAYTKNGVSGITSSAYIRRIEPLKYINYF